MGDAEEEQREGEKDGHGEVRGEEKRRRKGHSFLDSSFQSLTSMLSAFIVLGPRGSSRPNGL